MPRTLDTSLPLRLLLGLVLSAAALTLVHCGPADTSSVVESRTDSSIPPGAPCTVASELSVCGPGALCIHGACAPIPTCLTQADCDPFQLRCDSSWHLCGRIPAGCSSDADCQAPASRCDLSTRHCSVPDCKNGGVTCAPPDSECASDGRCVEPVDPTPPPPPPPPPSGCASDKDCCPFAPGCNGEVQHCEISKGTGTCQAGCRSHDTCKAVGLKSCNGLYECIAGGKQGDKCVDGYPKTDLENCRFGYYCCPILHQCFEQCKTPGETCPDTGKKCVAWFTGPKCIG